jgi:hypothetical protein
LGGAAPTAGDGAPPEAREGEELALLGDVGALVEVVVVVGHQLQRGWGRKGAGTGRGGRERDVSDT